MRYKILSFGYTLGLLKVREGLLNRAGFDVDTAFSFQEAGSLVSRHEYDLAIVGHAVDAGERNRLAELIRQRCPNAAIIFLYRGSIHEAQLADGLLSVAAGEEQVVAAACDVIARRRQKQQPAANSSC